MQQLCRDGYFCLLQDMVFTLEKGIFVEVAVAAPSAPIPALIARFENLHCRKITPVLASPSFSYPGYPCICSQRRPAEVADLRL